jgi:hypothetical protein
VSSQAERSKQTPSGVFEEGSAAGDDQCVSLTRETDVPYWTPSPDCRVCGRQSVPGSYLCSVCRQLIRRVDTRKDSLGRGWRIDKKARLEALCKQWDRTVGAFRCHYTRMRLLTDPYGSRRYATWEHVIPGDESSVVLVADVVNKMKGDMREAEFRAIVRALARYFDGGQFDESSIPLDAHSSIPVLDAEPETP